jgi:hypothetical protein
MVELTAAGLAQVTNNLSGVGTIPASESRVQDWIAQMEAGGPLTDDGPKQFEGELVPVVEFGGRRTESEAKSLMVAHYQAHKSLYPASIKSPASRKRLIDLLMDGMEVEEAFSAMGRELEGADTPLKETRLAIASFPGDEQTTQASYRRALRRRIKCIEIRWEERRKQGGEMAPHWR